MITLNAIAASAAVDDFLFGMLGLVREDGTREFVRYLSRRREWQVDEPRRDDDCPECSAPHGRLSCGAAVELLARPMQKRHR